MVDADRILAIYIANMMLNDPETSEEDKQTIRDHPEETITNSSNKLKGRTHLWKEVKRNDRVFFSTRSFFATYFGFQSMILK